MFDDEDPDPREDEIEIDDGAGADGPDPVDDEPEVEASDEDEPEVDEPVEGEDDDQEEAEPAPQPRKGKTKEENFAAVRARERAATERADRAERALAEARRPAPQVHQQETHEAKRARFAAMSPEDRAVAILAEGEERIHRTTQLAEFRVAESEDRANFNEIVRADPRAKKYAPQVEQVLLTERQAGRNWPRATILKFILGERVMANGPKAKKQQDAANVEARRQGGRPEKPKGDTGGSGKQRLTEAQAREKRLTGVKI